MLLTLGHDLKDPLVTIKGFCELLERDIAAAPFDKTKASEHLSIVIDATEAIQQLVQNLNAYNRFLPNKGTEGNERVDVAKLLRSVIAALRSAIEESGAKIVWQPNEMPTITTDPLKLYHVFMNLVSNAIKHYGRTGHPLIRIGYKRDRHYHIFNVRDNGSGISLEKQGQIFKPFTQLRRNRDGSGLGLAIVKRILDDMRGFIDVKSKENAGSTFAFGIPAASRRIVPSKAISR